MPVDPSEAYAVISRDYFFMALLVSLGTLQIAVSLGGFRGLYLLPWRNPTRFAGMLLISAGVLYFFLAPLWVEGPWAAGSVAADSSVRLWGRAAWADLGAARNVNDVDGGLSGGSQALWFPIATVIALAISIASGYVGMKLTSQARQLPVREASPSQGSTTDGLDALREADFREALGRSVTAMRRSFRQDAMVFWREAPRWALPRAIARRLGWDVA